MYPGRLDEKGRLKMPAAFAQYFSGLPETRLFVTSLDGRIARLYDIAEWRRMERFLATRPKESAKKANSMLFNSSEYGAEVEMDSQGRITLPPEIRKDLGLENQALKLFPIGDHIDILTERMHQERKIEAAKLTTDDVEQIEAERWTAPGTV